MKRRFFLLAAPAIIAAPSLMKVSSRIITSLDEGRHFIIVGRDFYNIYMEERIRFDKEFAFGKKKFMHIDRIVTA